MKFRFQAFDRHRELQKGVMIADSEAEVRRMLEALGYVCVVQCDPRPSIFQRFVNYPADTFAKVSPSEQFIPAEPVRDVAVRTDSGLKELRLIGHVEKLGGAEYLQLWTCLTLYVFTALAMWWLFPPLREIDLRDWLSEEQQQNVAGYNTQLFKSFILTIGNSMITLIALMISLAMKHSLKRTGLTVLIVYAVQWLACSSVLDAEREGGGATRFMAEYPVYTAVAWALPVVVMVGAERALRQLLEMTIPVYEDPETGQLEAGGRGVRAV